MTYRLAALALLLLGCLAGSPAPPTLLPLERPCGGEHGWCHRPGCMTPLCDWAERHRLELDILRAGGDPGEIGP